MKRQKTLHGFTAKQILEEAEGRKWVQLWLKSGGFRTYQIIMSPKDCLTVCDVEKTYQILY